MSAEIQSLGANLKRSRQRPSDVMNRKTFDRIVEEENCDAD
jgi:hypothetical protein